MKLRTSSDVIYYYFTTLACATSAQSPMQKCLATGSIIGDPIPQFRMT